MDLHALTVTVFTRGNPTPDVHSYQGFERNQLFLDQVNHFMECVAIARSSSGRSRQTACRVFAWLLPRRDRSQPGNLSTSHPWL